METINFQDFQFEVQRRVYYALQKTFPSLEIIDFNKVFECDERVAYMKFEFFQKYPDGQLPIQKLEQEKEENVEYILEKLLPIFRKKEGI